MPSRIAITTMNTLWKKILFITKARLFYSETLQTLNVQSDKDSNLLLKIFCTPSATNDKHIYKKKQTEKNIWNDYFTNRKDNNESFRAYDCELKLVSCVQHKVVVGLIFAMFIDWTR